MSQIKEIHKKEQVIVRVLNFDGWNLEWSGGDFEHYDAKGYTPKGSECVIEMKFRNKYYSDKLLEKYKYDKLIQMDEKIVKLYFINDPQGNYLFWLNDIKIPPLKDMWCPDTTFWTKKKILKPCYLIPETQASIINQNEED